MRILVLVALAALVHGGMMEDFCRLVASNPDSAELQQGVESLAAKAGCDAGGSIAPPVATKSAGHRRLAGRMDVLLASTAHPFWFAVPSPEDLPGYYIDSFRSSRVMCPSLSLLFHHFLSEKCGGGGGGRRGLVVDVGAHLGWFSFLAASYGCRAIAVEPQPHTAAFINATIALNGWGDRIRLVQAAVCEHGGSVRIVNDAPNDWAVASTVAVDSSQEGDVVPCVRIDELTKEEVLLLKIDTEGLEYESIRSASGLLEKGLVATLVVETKPEDVDGRKRKWLQSMLSSSWFAYTFFEEVFRTVDDWSIQNHVFPLHRVRDFDNWPESQEYQDHVFVRQPLPIPTQPEVTMLFPPNEFRFWKASAAAASIAVRGMAPKDCKVRLYLNGQNAGDYAVGGLQNSPDYSRLDISLSETMPEGQHTLAADLVDVHGEVIAEGEEVTFFVDHSAPRPTSMDKLPHWYYHVYGAHNLNR